MKALVIGLGGIGQRHVRNLRTVLGDGVEILAWRVRRLSHVVTPALQSDATCSVEHEYRIRTFNTLASALMERPNSCEACGLRDDTSPCNIDSSCPRIARRRRA